MTDLKILTREAAECHTLADNYNPDYLDAWAIAWGALDNLIGSAYDKRDAMRYLGETLTGADRSRTKHFLAMMRAR